MQFFSQPWKNHDFFHGCEKNCVEGLGSRLSLICRLVRSQVKNPSKHYNYFFLFAESKATNNHRPCIHRSSVGILVHMTQLGDNYNTGLFFVLDFVYNYYRLSVYVL